MLLDVGVFWEEVVNFVMKSFGKIISILVFEEKFYGEEQFLQQYFNENQVEMQDEFCFD